MILQEADAAVGGASVPRLGAENVNKLDMLEINSQAEGFMSSLPGPPLIDKNRSDLCTY